jgi:hypothetical protein
MKKTIKIEFLGVIITVVTCEQNKIVDARNGLRKDYPELPKFPNSSHMLALHTALYESYPGRNWIFIHKTTRISSITHEVQHCVDTISEWFDINDTEFRAYLFDYIISKILGEKDYIKFK